MMLDAFNRGLGLAVILGSKGEKGPVLLIGVRKIFRTRIQSLDSDAE